MCIAFSFQQLTFALLVQLFPSHLDGQLSLLRGSPHQV
jgi:hypothetical protein